jgi:hypothetical protein
MSTPTLAVSCGSTVLIANRAASISAMTALMLVAQQLTVEFPWTVGERHPDVAD